MNNSDNSFINAPLHSGETVPLNIAKFIVGFMAFSLYTIILIGLPSCLSIKKSSRMLLIMLCSLNFIYFTLLTFYSPFVGAGFIPIVKNKFGIKFISFIWLFPIYSLHYAQTVMATDRLIAIGFAHKYEIYFSHRRTQLLIASVLLYGVAYALPSVFDCCYTTFEVSKQLWLYPNDNVTHYRQYFGLISNYGNGIITALMYCHVIYSLHKLKMQIHDIEMRRSNLRKQTSLFIMFAVPWLITMVLSITIQLTNQIPPSVQPTWLSAFSDFTRYVYILEPILILSMVKQIRIQLRNKSTCVKNEITSVTTTMA